VVVDNFDYLTWCNMLLIPPNYGLCLRIFHPNIDPDEITTCLGLIPDRYWVAGRQRCTPQGRLLEGVNQETYWSYSFETTEEIGPNEFLNQIFLTLHPNKELFDAISNSGGHTEIYFTIRSDENAGETIKWETLKNFVNLKIDLSIELFV
jgi:hypothetical protein